MSKFLLSHSAALDSSEKRWCNWRSCSLVQPMPGHHIPSTWFTCSGNIVWVLLYPWQWTPADALDPAPLTGWLACMDEAWALPWLVLSAPGMGSGSPLQKTQLAVCTPPPSSLPSCSRLLYSTWLDLSSTTQRPCSCRVNVSARMSHWLTCNDAVFPCICHKCFIFLFFSKEAFTEEESPTLQPKKCFPGHIAPKLTRCYVIMFPLVSQGELFSIFTVSAAFFASHTFLAGNLNRNKICYV